MTDILLGGHSTFLAYLAHFFLECETFETDGLDEIKTQNIYSVTPPLYPPPPENRAVFEIMRKKTL